MISFSKPINPIYDILLQNPLLIKLNWWYMFVNALIHKTQLRYTFSEPYLLTNPIMEYFLQSCLYSQNPIIISCKETLLANPNYVALHLEMKSITHKNPIMTWIFQGPFITLTKPNSCILFCFSHYWHKPNYDLLLPKPIYSQVHPITVFPKPDTPEILLLQTKDWKTRWEWRKLHLCVKSSNFKTK